jgi:hypothetical protein
MRSRLLLLRAIVCPLQSVLRLCHGPPFACRLPRGLIRRDGGRRRVRERCAAVAAMRARTDPVHVDAGGQHQQRRAEMRLAVRWTCHVFVCVCVQERH